MTEVTTTDAGTAAPGRLRLRKACKLRHLGLVNHVFADGGRREFVYPVRMVWGLVPGAELDELFHSALPPHFGPVQMLITVPKKQLHHAVDRVLMRRRMREAFRLNRHMLHEVTPQPGQAVLAMAFIYMAPKTKSFAAVEKAMRKLLDRVVTTIGEGAAEGEEAGKICARE